MSSNWGRKSAQNFANSRTTASTPLREYTMHNRFSSADTGVDRINSDSARLLRLGIQKLPSSNCTWLT